MMTISFLTSSNNSLFVDYELPALPEEIKKVVLDPEYTFYMLGPWEDGKTFEFSNKQLYRREGGKIERMDYTGDVYFGDIYYLEADKDLSLIFKAVFIKGLLDSLEVILSDYHCNELRKKTQAVFFRVIRRQERLHASPLYNLVYRPYYLVVRGLLWVAKAATFYTFKAIDRLITWVSRILTPI